MRWVPVAWHNRYLLAWSMCAAAFVSYVTIMLRYWNDWQKWYVHLVALGIAAFVASMYLGFLLWQLFYDVKKKRKWFYKVPLKYLRKNGFEPAFSRLTPWNFASSWCLRIHNPSEEIEIDIDKIASEQKSYLHLRIRPHGYSKKHLSAERIVILEEWEGVADPKSFVFFLELNKLTSMGEENLNEWIAKRITGCREWYAPNPPL